MELREWIQATNPGLVEDIDTGKWFGGLLTYTTSTGVFLYAMGPRKGDQTTLHMMPYYSSPELQSRVGPDLKKFLTGKSCIQFKQVEDLPKQAILEIFGATDKFMEVWNQMIAKKAEKKRSQRKADS